MAFSRGNWVILPIAILIFLGVMYWGIGKIQYRNNVMDIEEYEPKSQLYLAKLMASLIIRDMVLNLADIYIYVTEMNFDPNI